MKKGVFVLGVFVLMLFISGCNVEVSEEYPFSFGRMIYSISECDETREKSMEKTNIIFEGDTILLDQSIEYVCCANISLNYRIDEDVLRIYEDNKGDMCKCMCTYDIKAKIKEKGINEVEVYGIKYSDWPYEFIIEKKR